MEERRKNSKRVASLTTTNSREQSRHRKDLVMREDILRKLQKLQGMVEGGTTNEKIVAQRIFDTLIEKYDIQDSELERKENRELKTSPKMRKYISHVCHSLGIDVYTYTKRKNSPLILNSTYQEFCLVLDIYKQISAVMKAKEKEVKNIVDSYTSGFVVATYPVTQKDPVCPGCEKTLRYSDIDRRYYCEHCGWKGKKLKKKYYDYDAFNSGKESSGRMITHK